MAKYKIAWLPGDGVGVELAHCAERVLESLQLDAELISGDIGWEFWKNEGNPLPDRTVDILENTDCAFMAAITSKPATDAIGELGEHMQGKGFTYRSPIIRIRQLFNLHTNLRPCKAYSGNALNHADGTDLVIFRENTEGLYVGVEFYPLPQAVYDSMSDYNENIKRFPVEELNETALSARIVTKKGCHQIIMGAFLYARKHNRRSVTLVEKPNVLRETGGLMRRTALEIAPQFPDIEFQEVNVDAMCMWMVKNPHAYDVIVAGNMFGDIISDLAAQLIGGLGFAGSANLGDDYAVFEPSHGSAPKYAGQNKVNPIATFQSIKMMLEWLGETEKSVSLEAAITQLISEQKVGTFDMGMNNTNIELTEEICRLVST